MINNRMSEVKKMCQKRQRARQVNIEDLSADLQQYIIVNKLFYALV